MPAYVVRSASYACTFVPMASPKFVRAVDASDAPVPPSATAMSVAVHVPAVTAPAEVTLNALAPIAKATRGLVMPIPTLPFNKV